MSPTKTIEMWSLASSVSSALEIAGKQARMVSPVRSRRDITYFTRWKFSVGISLCEMQSRIGHGQLGARVRLKRDLLEPLAFNGQIGDAWTDEATSFNSGSNSVLVCNWV